MNQIYNHALVAGTRIESYEIRDVLGVGGFGITYRAHDHTLEQTVAIKEYLPDGLAYRLPDNKTLTHKSESDIRYYRYGLQRFLDEARTLARFRDPSIVRVVRFIEANGTAYLVMDFESGQPLARRLRDAGRLSEKAVRQLLRPLLLGLRSVHEQGFLHRDVKPANILLRSEGPPVLLDFGAARQALGEQTKALTTMVTPGYAPFEQYYTKDRQGAWTDLYGLGATLFHCLTGRAPAAATERVAAAYEHERDPADLHLDVVSDDYSADLIEAVRWMIKPHAKDRPQNVDEVLQRLRLDAAPSRLNGADAYSEINAPGPEAGVAVKSATLSPELLKSVHVNLEEHIGPMARALVQKAGRQASSVEQLTELLARFIPSEEDKTQFLGKTRMLGRGPVAPRTTQPARATGGNPPSSITGDAEFVAVNEETIRFAKQCLASQVGPIAGMLVRKAAKRAADPKDFVRRLAAELNDDDQRSRFLRQMSTHQQ